MRVQEQGLQLPSIQPAVFKPSQPASNTSQPASKPANLASEPGQPSQPSRPASQPAQPAQPASQSTRRKGFLRGPQLAPYVASQVWKKHYDSLQILGNAPNSKIDENLCIHPAQPAQPVRQPANQPPASIQVEGVSSRGRSL